MAREKDYLAVAKKEITRPSLRQSYRRILVYGRNKKGKSTFGLSAGISKTLLIDTEGGTDAMLRSNPYVWHVTRWTKLQDILGALRTGELSPKLLDKGPEEEPFEWVCFDGLTRFNNLALRFVMKTEEERNLERQPGFVDRRDYGKSGELMKEFLMQAHALKLNICYTAQERMRTFAGEEDEDESEVFFIPDLPDAVRAAANAWVEVIGRMTTANVTIGEKEKIQRRLYIGIHERYDTGFRSDFELPDLIKNPTLPKLVEMMVSGPPAPRKKVGTKKIAEG